MRITEAVHHTCRKITPHKRTRLKTALLASAVLSGLFAVTQPAVAATPATTQNPSWSLPAGPLDQALNRLAVQSHLTVSYSPDLVKGKTTRGLSGTYTPTEALHLLLAGTGLTFDALNATTFVLRPAPTPTPANSTGQSSPSESAPRQKAPTNLEKVVVTGTRIKGVQPSSPLLMITQDDMRLAGDNNLGDVIRSLPQNFSGGQNPGVQSGASAGGAANQNITGGSSLNLRGLGPDATLTLLNGTRLPYDGFSQATDVAVIPAAAIERMDVLLDGASAIYGSDAVGGVANILLKRDYNGAEITARTGAATDGGYDQTQVSMVTGNTWASGGLLIAAERDSDGAVRASQRDYLSYIPHPHLLTIYPKTSQNGVLLSGHQELGSSAELTLDTFLTKRSMAETSLYSASGGYDYDTDGKIYGISPSLRIALPHDWSVRVNVFDGEDDTVAQETDFSLTTGGTTGAKTQTYVDRYTYSNRTQSAGLEFEGALFALPGGDARMSLGGGWRKADFEQLDLTSGVTSVKGSDALRYVYDEVNLPLIGENQGIPLVNSLSLNAAIRYDDYNQFGGTTTPKIGMLWNVAPSLDIRASWGKSFKTPTLTQEFAPSQTFLYTASAIGIKNEPGNATVFERVGGNPNLGPERANVTTAGFVFRPPFLEGATIDVDWFDISYKQRVVRPYTSLAQFDQSLTDPSYDRFITRNPTPSQQMAILQSATFINRTGATYDPNNVLVIFDNRYANATAQRVRGVDLGIRYSAHGLKGLWAFSADGSWITNSERQLVAGGSAAATAGVAYFPPRFKGRLSGSWSRSAFTVSAIVNRLGGVRNTGVISSASMGDSMTTLDLVFDYAADPHALGGLGFNLSVMNVFNQRPPLLAPIQPYYVNYDSTNYSALGRVVSLAITKHF